jgi:murein endopeptidase
MEIELNRYYPAELHATFAALVAVVQQRARVQSSDEFSGTVNFATPMKGWASGCNVQAYVSPMPHGGVQVIMHGQARRRTHVNKQLVAILDAVSKNIQRDRQLATASP